MPTIHGDDRDSWRGRSRDYLLVAGHSPSQKPSYQTRCYRHAACSAVSAER